MMSDLIRGVIPSDLRSISWCENLLWRWEVDQGWGFGSSSHIGWFRYSVDTVIWVSGMNGFGCEEGV